MPEIPNYLAYVERADALLPGRICEGNDGVLEVVNLACQLAVRDGHTDVGLLIKTAGERSHDRAADIMCLDLGDGACQVVDVVISSGGPEARIGWQVMDRRPIEQWRPPFDWPIPGAPETPQEPPQTPQEPPAVPTSSSDLAPVLAALEGIAARLDALLATINAQRTEQVAGLAQVAAAAKEGIKLKFGF